VVPAAACVARVAPISTAPATLVSESQVPGSAGRLEDVVLRSPAMQSDVRVYVLLPIGYARHRRARLPVLYLLRGGGQTFRAWADHGVEALIDRESVAAHLKPFITVMPDGGLHGFFSDWVGQSPGAKGPPPAYSTYFMDELIPWIDAHYRTLPTRAGRAIAGLSMGGFGAMSFAARYPDRFAVAGSFSGAVDTELGYQHQADFFYGRFADICMWGNPSTDRIAWRAVDPTYLAPNLAGVSLYLASGNGRPGEATLGTPPGYSATEALIWQMNRRFAAALRAAHVSFTSSFYGPGAHSWPYWLRDLRDFLPLMERAFGRPPPAPPQVAFNYRTADRTAEIWSWRFAIHHPRRDFTYLTEVSERGLTITGQGRLSVTTAPLYLPLHGYIIRIPGVPPRRIRAGRYRRLRFTVQLPPPHSTTRRLTTSIEP
jgi:S-formylglutathione hydrolase FrmB